MEGSTATSLMSKQSKFEEADLPKYWKAALDALSTLNDNHIASSALSTSSGRPVPLNPYAEIHKAVSESMDSICHPSKSAKPCPIYLWLHHQRCTKDQITGLSHRGIRFIIHPSLRNTKILLIHWFVRENLGIGIKMLEAQPDLWTLVYAMVARVQLLRTNLASAQIQCLDYLTLHADIVLRTFEGRQAQRLQSKAKEHCQDATAGSLEPREATVHFSIPAGHENCQQDRLSVYRPGGKLRPDQKKCKKGVKSRNSSSSKAAEVDDVSKAYGW